MTASRFLSLSTALLACSALASAQSIVPPHMVQIGKSVEWPGGFGAGNFGATEPAHLVPHGATGLVMEWGSKLVYAHSPLNLNVVVDTGFSPTAFAIVPGDIDAGVMDVLLITTSTGLAAVSYDSSTQAIDFTSTALSGTSAAADAVALACADFDGDGDTDIAAALSDAKTITTFYADGSGGFITGASFTQPATILDLEPIEWDDSGSFPGKEIAVRFTVGTKVYTKTGSQRFAKLATYGGNDMAVVGPYVAVSPLTTVETRDKLVIVQPNGSGRDQLSLHSLNENETAQALGPIDVVGLDAGDYDNDGDWDLAVSQSSSTELWILHNKTYDPVLGEGAFDDTFTGDAADRKELRIGEDRNLAMSDNNAEPCLADISDDGFVEVIMGVRDDHIDEGGDFLYRVEGESDGDYEDSGDCPGVFSGYSVYTGGDLEYDDLNGVLNEDVTKADRVGVEFSISNIWHDYETGSLPNDAYLEVTVWKQTECNDVTVNTSPFRHVLYWIDPATNADFLTMDGPALIGFTVSKVTPTGHTGSLEFVNKYYAEVRLARYVGGVISSPFSPEIISFTGQIDVPTNANCLTDLHISNDPGMYGDCSSMPPTILGSGSGSQDYDTTAYAQAQVPTPSSGSLLYPTLQTVVAQ